MKCHRAYCFVQISWQTVYYLFSFALQRFTSVFYSFSFVVCCVFPFSYFSAIFTAFLNLSSFLYPFLRLNFPPEAGFLNPSFNQSFNYSVFKIIFPLFSPCFSSLFFLLLIPLLPIFQSSVFPDSLPLPCGVIHLEVGLHNHGQVS